MRLSLAVLSVALAASVIAQAPPDCAIPCITNSSTYGGCAADDNNCLCHNQIFINLTTICIEQDCTGSDLTSALTFAQTLCAKVGVNLNSTSSAPASSQTSADSSPSSPPSNANTQGSGALSHTIHAAAGLAFVSSVVGLLL